MMPRPHCHWMALSSLAAALCLPGVAGAQDRAGESGAARGSGVEIAPYIAAAQVLTAELEPGDDVLTYTSLAAGVDAALTGRYSAGSASLRYERRIGYGNNQVDGDTISGIARTSLALVPRNLTLEAGGLAARTRVDGNGSSSIGGFGVDEDATSQIYSVYAGPDLQASAGEVAVTGGYRLGYTRVEAPDAVIATPGGEPVDIFDESVTHVANVRAGVAPQTVLPVGVGIGAGWTQQDISNLDQRVRDTHVRADLTVPVSPSVALVGGVGYEDVQVSSRDAVRDADGDPVIGSDGRYLTDRGEPRTIAYETDGLIWDLGVMWRPSRRTALEAYVGRRYGSTTYHGSLSYAPNPRSSFNIGVYDNVTGFGGAVIDSLAGLPTDFEAFRNPITGDLAACVSSLEGGNCALGSLGSIRSAVFRSRGISASYGRSTGRTSYGIAAGYDRRRFIAAAGTVLESADGVIDENWWAAAYATRRIDSSSSVSANASVNWFDSGFDMAGDGVGYSTTLSYYREIFGGLSGTAAAGLDGITRDSLPDVTTASGLVGLRYTF